MATVRGDAIKQIDRVGSPDLEHPLRYKAIRNDYNRNLSILTVSWTDNKEGFKKKLSI